MTLHTVEARNRSREKDLAKYFGQTLLITFATLILLSVLR